MPKLTMIIALLCTGFSAELAAREIAGVKVAEQIELAGQTLQLNGAGIRSKFVFDIYIGALYVTHKSNKVKDILSATGPKRVMMHFLHDEVDKQKLIDGWLDGFENNHSSAEFEKLKPRLLQFNNLFVTANKGDVIVLDYLPGQGTRVSINNSLVGTVEGEDFNRGLLKVWLGDDPADDTLKDAMLGVSTD